MLMFIDSGLMGGVALVSTQFARANNPRLEENWDPNQKQKYISTD